MVTKKKLEEWEKTVYRHGKPPFISHLPYPIAHFLGYRKSPNGPENQIIREITIFIVTIGSVLAMQAITMYAGLFKNRWHIESMLLPFAASSILVDGSQSSPFAQPRNFILGQFFSGLIGLCIVKLFMTNSNNEQYLWLAGALGVACASVFMDIFGIVHPPAGATALIPALDSEYRKLGWNYLPLILIHTAVFLGIALLLNNFTRVYPVYWWSPKPIIKEESDSDDPEDREDIQYHHESSIMIEGGVIRVPHGLKLTRDERSALTTFQVHMRKYEAQFLNSDSSDNNSQDR